MAGMRLRALLGSWGLSNHSGCLATAQTFCSSSGQLELANEFLGLKAETSAMP